MYLGFSTLHTIGDVNNYKGSGKDWNEHLKVYGNDVTTIILKYFDEYSEKECMKYCLSLSKRHNIVKSKHWANLKPEDGGVATGGHGI